jgi:hypothetical protein
MILRIDSAGAIHTIYAEQVDLGLLGVPSIHRASFVEPDQRGLWWADLTPVNGPVHGPFRHRSEALEMEQQWLIEHWLLRQPTSFRR